MRMGAKTNRAYTRFRGASGVGVGIEIFGFGQGDFFIRMAAMKRWISMLSAALIVGLAVIAWGQWQAQPQVDSRVGPIYPVNPAYNFYSASNYNPFQFNWGTGQWDYMPIPPGQSSAGFPAEPAPPPVPYSRLSQPSSPAHGPAHTVNPAPKPDDSELWSVPTTRPAPAVAPKIVKFEGRIVAIKAVSLVGQPNPHLLLRLRNDAGATGTVDVGQRLVFPDAAFDPGAKGHVSVSGQLGILDGHLVLFADQIDFGSRTVTIGRPGEDAAK